MNGLDASPEPRKIAPEMPIILCAAFGEAVSASALKAKGVTLTLAKSEFMRSVHRNALSLSPITLGKQEAGLLRVENFNAKQPHVIFQPRRKTFLKSAAAAHRSDCCSLPMASKKTKPGSSRELRSSTQEWLK